MKKMIKFGARKRYEEGGEVDEGERAKEYVASKAETAPSTFREAFAQARKAGQERFTFNGSLTRRKWQDLNLLHLNPLRPNQQKQKLNLRL